MNEIYGYKLGEIVENVIELIDEGGLSIDHGTKLRLVAFAPKVRIPMSMVRQNPSAYDKKPYFFNAVRASQENDSGNRIRANFVTIRKIK